MLVVTKALVDRMVALEIDNLKSRLEPYALRPGNPSGVYVRPFGDATAFMAHQIPVRFFNSVLGTSPKTMDHIDGIEAFYGEHGQTCAFEIVPERMTEDLGHRLFERGYRIVEFHAGLARELSPDDAERPATAGVEVRELDPTDSAELELFLDTYLLGWGSTDLEAAKQNMRGWAANATWRFYVADKRGQTAGAGLLDVREDIALLGSASTVPEARGHRVQGALLHHRIREAARLGVKTIVGGAYYGTTSMRNQQRAGLDMAFTRGIWVATRT